MYNVWVLALITNALLILKESFSNAEKTVKNAYLNISYTNSHGQRVLASGTGTYGTHGPQMPVQGILVSVEGEHWCGAFNLKPVKEPWIALIPRGRCTFRKKIALARKNNATAVLIFNHQHKSDEYVMITDPDEKVVAVSISHKLGITLESLRNSGSNITVGIQARETEESDIEVTMWMVLAFPILSMIILFMIATLLLQLKLKRKKMKKNDDILSGLAITVFKAGDEADDCAICLENYRSGQSLRLLQCGHRFHKACIDPWILEQDTCPLCKRSLRNVHTVETCRPTIVTFRVGNEIPRPALTMQECSSVSRVSPRGPPVPVNLTEGNDNQGYRYEEIQIDMGTQSLHSQTEECAA